jgi:hypothetical protein
MIVIRHLDQVEIERIKREHAGVAADEELRPGWYWGEAGDPFPGVGPFDTREACERDAVEECGSHELSGIEN